MRRWAYLLVVSLCITGCSSKSVAPFAIPPHVVSDQIVVPFELTAVYDQLKIDLSNWNLRRWQQLRDPATAPGRPLDERRAFMYTQLNHVIDTIHVRTMPGSDGAYDSLIEEIAKQIDFRIRSRHYNSFEGFEDGRTTDYHLQSNIALSEGEMAWIGEWIFLQSPQKILFVASGNDDTDIVSSGN